MQHDLVIDNSSGAGIRADVNSAFAAVATQMAGVAAPTTTYPNMAWYDSSQQVMKRRDDANAAWIPQRSTLTQNTYYVRADGNDANNGLANDTGHAWATVQKAVDWLTSYGDVGSYNSLFISLAAGVYAGNVTLRTMPGGVAPTILGLQATPLSVSMITSLGPLVQLQPGASWQLSGLKLATLGNSGGQCLLAAGGCYANVDCCVFGGAIGVAIEAGRGAEVQLGSLSIVGSSPGFIDVHHGAKIAMGFTTITFSGSPGFSSRFALARAGGYLETVNLATTNSAVGARFLVTGLGIINVSGSNQLVLPGTVAGTIQSAGIYI